MSKLILIMILVAGATSLWWMLYLDMVHPTMLIVALLLTTGVVVIVTLETTRIYELDK